MSSSAFISCNLRCKLFSGSSLGGSNLSVARITAASVCCVNNSLNGLLNNSSSLFNGLFSSGSLSLRTATSYQAESGDYSERIDKFLHFRKD